MDHKENDEYFEDHAKKNEERMIRIQMIPGKLGLSLLIR
jgi:hypothetical protein